MTDTAVTPTSATELLPHIELTAVRTYALAGRRDDEPRSEDVVPEIGVRLGVDEIETRMRIVVSTGEATLEADIGVIYRLVRPTNLWSQVVSEFIERVAALAVYPFVREAIFATASRMGVDAPVLGLIRQGEFKVGELNGSDFAPSRQSASVAALAREFGVSAQDVVGLLRALEIAVPEGRKKVLGEDAALVRYAALAQGTQQL